MSEAQKKTIKPKGSDMCPPSLWTCPKCGTKVTTFVPTFPLECRNNAHRREMFVMVASRPKGNK